MLEEKNVIARDEHYNTKTYNRAPLRTTRVSFEMIFAILQFVKRLYNLSIKYFLK